MHVWTTRVVCLCVCVLFEHVLVGFCSMKHVDAAHQNLAQERNVTCSIDCRGHVVLPPVSCIVCRVVFVLPWRRLHICVLVEFWWLVLEFGSVGVSITHTVESLAAWSAASEENTRAQTLPVPHPTTSLKKEGNNKVQCQLRHFCCVVTEQLACPDFQDFPGGHIYQIFQMFRSPGTLANKEFEDVKIFKIFQLVRFSRSSVWSRF